MANTANDTIHEWLQKLNAALQESDSQQAAELFREDQIQIIFYKVCQVGRECL